MSKPLEDFLRLEFSRLEDLLRADWQVTDAILDAWRPEARTSYRAFLSFACLATLAEKGSPAKSFCGSAVEASHLSFALILKGATNSAYTLLRQSMESILKFVYFNTHTVELGWCETRDDYKEITFQFLKEYACRTDEMDLAKTAESWSQQVTDKFARLSRFVHIQNQAHSQFPNLWKASRLRPDVPRKFYKEAEQVFQLLTLTVLIFRPQAFVGASALNQRLIMRGISSSMKTAAKAYIRTVTT